MIEYFSLKNVSVYYNIYRSADRSIKNKILNSIGGNIFKKDNSEFVHALKNISISIKSGERIGLIGPNGAGKSTFLKLLAGCIEPLEGTITRNGKINSILSLNMGLDAELTGLENIKLQSHFRNYTKKKYVDFLNSVISFSELDNFIDMPIESYSSGMSLRLAFAIATFEVPEILLLDEIINVGDKDFSKKSKKRIEDLIDSSNVLILSSHDESIIKNYCNKIYRFNKGSFQIEKI
jgi:ABC-type polysaccharide/polyol phosphate transport system ATPase subunit